MDDKTTSRKSEAMLWFAIIPSLALVALLVVLVRTVRADGLGHRPPPAGRPGVRDGRTW
ncbi:hypothetical protein H9657_11590 [Cellulomonas sp. Sa3CUA2]|uniref:Uncharacterized protein n=1 Tax=Cellulomonas avistercoris TaxID=2762242 RepID=A0ABR8QEX4_9CELL|nr:hypothetical protein [Cellulomonas avistercoris]MBD7918916.1 hypothetical protein [Cellulomonas avistercoris]